MTCARCGDKVNKASLTGHYDVRIVDDAASPKCGRACTYSTPSRKVFVQRSYWDRWSAAARTMAIAHEIGHNAMDTDCEDCCDTFAGRYARANGLSRSQAVDGIREAIGDARPKAPYSAANGYDRG